MVKINSAKIGESHVLSHIETIFPLTFFGLQRRVVFDCKKESWHTKFNSYIVQVAKAEARRRTAEGRGRRGGNQLQGGQETRGPGEAQG